MPVIVGGHEVFRIKAKLGSFTPDIRVEAIQRKLNELEERPDFDAGTVTTVESLYSTDVVAAGTTIVTITDADALAAGASSRQELASDYAARLRAALQQDVKERSLPSLLIRIGLTILCTIGFIALLCMYARLFPRLYRAIASVRGKFIRPLKFQQAVLLSEDTITEIFIGTFRLLRLAVVVFSICGYVTLVLSLFPQTQGYVDTVVRALLRPVTDVVWPAVVLYLPNVLYIVVICVISYYVISFTRFFFREIERGTISFPSFEREWAEPTYKIVRFLLIVFTVMLIFPYLPGSGSPAFQQISIFLGVLISLSSTGSLSHVIAGVFLTYTKAFRVGDRVKIADTIGDVVEKTFLATRIRTIKHEFITIPNGLVLGSHIINYSASGGNPGLILHTSVTIGYDAPWQKVQELLIAAALATEHILNDPPPFVLQRSLNDFSVSYEINGYTDKAQCMAEIYSELHKNIQEKFNAAGVEIMSPQYHAVRDGNTVTIPHASWTDGYQPPSFRVSLQPSAQQPLTGTQAGASPGSD